MILILSLISFVNRNQITSALENTRVAVIVGAAGCGKSTRVPAMILRDCGINAAVIVSEPRRVAAIGLAERVASEMQEEVSHTRKQSIHLYSNKKGEGWWLDLVAYPNRPRIFCKILNSL